ncbi:Gfo/Idh/MocA family protein [Armatimonas sp.]|uniref:Gfo/Idh/MocA family protein n=1 Tax=Armatimonas sp. TaxID=1872638 RepID=UPI00374CE8EB
MSLHKTWTAAVVGGGMGGKLSLNALAASERFALTAACDLHTEVREALATSYPRIAVFASHEEMLAQCPTEVVCVSTYPPSHEEVTLAALESGAGLKGILVEKPLGHTFESGRRILEAIAAKQIPVAVPHGLLAKATPIEIIQRVQNNELGRLVLVEIQCKGWDILNAGIHWLHFCRMLAPDDAPRSVHAAIDASTRTYRDGLQVETAAVTSIVHASGLRVVMHTGDETPVNVAGKSFVFRLIGERGVIEFWGWENGYLLNGERHTPQEFPRTGHRRHLENMADQMEGIAPLDDTLARASLSALELCEAAYLSGEYRAQITLPLTNFLPPDPFTDWQPGKPYLGANGGRDGRVFG